MRCTECDRSRSKRVSQRIYLCALCGEPRCEAHATWVPAHIIDDAIGSASQIQTMLTGKSVQGWYTFCGQTGHIPRGVSIRFGKEKTGGRIVERILPRHKAEGLEQFNMWETAAVEEGFEKQWQPQNYEISCSLAKLMRLIVQMYQTRKDPKQFPAKLHSLVFTSLARKKAVFYEIGWEEFKKNLGEEPDLEDFLRIVCSRCAVVICLNRQAPFYDGKLLRKLAQNPKLGMSI